MNRTEKIRHIYSIVIGVFAVAMGFALICVAADIYYSGKGTDVTFTREIVVERLQVLAIPFIILIGAIAVGVIFPLYEVKAKRKSEDSVRLLSSKEPTGGEGKDYVAAEKKYRSLTLARYHIWGFAIAITLCCAIAELCYLLNTAHFSGENITAEIFAMVKCVLPCVFVTFVVLVGAAIANGIIAKRQLKELKSLIKLGNGVAQGASESSELRFIKRVLSHDITLWVVRGVVFVAAVVFIVLGIFNGGARDVMVKAINICTECIGLG